jgi:hypothetical protein
VNDKWDTQNPMARQAELTLFILATATAWIMRRHAKTEPCQAIDQPLQPIVHRQPQGHLSGALSCRHIHTPEAVACRDGARDGRRTGQGGPGPRREDQLMDFESRDWNAA